MVCRLAQSTAPSLVPWCVWVAAELHGEVSQGDGADRGWRATEPLPTAVLPDQFLSQLQPEGIDVFVLGTSTVVSLEDVRVRDGYIEEEEENVAVELAALRSTAVIAAKLVAPIHTTHRSVVGNY